MTTDQSKDRFTRLEEKLAKLPDCSPEERDAFAAEREANLGTTREWAAMQADGSIAVDISQWLLDGTYGHGSSTSIPGDPDYEELRTTHRLKKPGDASTVIKKWVNGHWEIQGDEGLQSDTKSKTA